MNVTSMKRPRGQRSASAGGNRFGTIWMLSGGDCERTATRFRMVALPLRWTKSVTKECKEV